MTTCARCAEAAVNVVRQVSRASGQVLLEELLCHRHTAAELALSTRGLSMSDLTITRLSKAEA